MTDENYTGNKDPLACLTIRPNEADNDKPTVGMVLEFTNHKNQKYSYCLTDTADMLEIIAHLYERITNLERKLTEE